MNTYHQYRDGGRSISLLMQCWAHYWSKDSAVSEEGAWAFSELLYLVESEPERAWECILYALNCLECQPHLGVLAAGPLEDLLCLHGAKFIDRIEELAISDPRFAHVLGGMWQSQIPPDIWARVQQVWDPSFWKEKVPKG